MHFLLQALRITGLVNPSLVHGRHLHTQLLSGRTVAFCLMKLTHLLLNKQLLQKCPVRTPGKVHLSRQRSPDHTYIKEKEVGH